MKILLPHVIASTLLILLTPLQSAACPLINSLVDYNCDQTYKITVTGDSIVKGVGDTRHNNEGGYVRILSENLPKATVGNIGVAGVTTRRLLRLFKRNLRKNRRGATQIRSENTDLIIIDVGRNDFWDHRRPGLTVRNIKRLVGFLRTELGGSDSAAPYIVVSTMIPTARSFQRGFINEVNRLLMKRRSRKLPVYLRFDRMSTGILSSDRLHPSTRGYRKLGRKVTRFVKTSAQSLAKQNRTDADLDGVYDLFETTKFSTNPQLPDTDGDQLVDGLELFTYLTDPLIFDTDSDGIDDGREIETGTNPLDPASPETSSQ